MSFILEGIPGTLYVIKIAAELIVCNSRIEFNDYFFLQWNLFISFPLMTPLFQQITQLRVGFTSVLMKENTGEIY